MDPYLEPELRTLPPSPQSSPDPDPDPDPEWGPDPECDPDLECAICFSQFNGVFRTPKVLQCRHTFCLECLARMNVKSSQPDSIQCPLCRSLTPLPPLGLPRLDTDRTVLSYLPFAMQRVYSIRFNRSKGRLQVKRTSEPRAHLSALRTVSLSLDVGLPTSPGRGQRGGGEGGQMSALLRLSGRPVCKVFLLSSVVVMMILLTGIIIFLLTYQPD